MNKKHLIQLAVYTVIILVAVVAWILPTFALVKKQKNSIYDERVKIEQQNQQFSDTKSLTQQYTKISEDVKALQAAFLSKDTDEILSFIDQIDAIGSEIGITDSVKISPLPASTSSPLVKSEITIKASGSYPLVMAFLSKIENISIYMNFTSIDINSKIDSIPPVFTLDAVGSVYWK